jgi:hypothetical protein
MGNRANTGSPVNSASLISMGSPANTVSQGSPAQAVPISSLG